MNLATVDQFVCMCPSGFEGAMCERVISPCVSSPCSSEATCVGSDDGSFVCICPAGFTGELCLTNIDDCQNNPCENNGVCTDGVDGFMCSCPPGFSGPTCAVPVLFCSPDACDNGGTCIEAGDGFTCTCPPGFTGTQCSEDVDECALEPCSNGATCVNTPGSSLCFCPIGFTGVTCDTQINFCSNDSCSFNGICNSLTDGFMCACDAGFTGERCEVDINECDFAECQNNATCMDGIGTFMCICDSGFTGTQCDINIDECRDSPCTNGGTCLDVVAGFSCDCPPGFSGNTCGDQVDFCVDQICYNGGTCGSTGSTFSCECPAGWAGDWCQFANNVVVKLDSCGFAMARDMLADAGLVDSNEPLSVNSGSPPVSFPYNLAGSRGIYFSGWIWQEVSTSSVLFSFTDDASSVAGQFISDLTTQELRFYYSSVTGSVINTTFTGIPLRPNTWMHIALAAFDDNFVDINVDGSFSQRQLLQSVVFTGSELTAGAAFEVPSAVLVNIARGVTELSSLDSAGAFSGLVRGVAINGITVGSNNFNLDALQNCTLGCIGGESFCLAGGRCHDLFGPERVCSCPYGFTGLRCQQMHDRLSFDGSGFARVITQSSNLESLQFSFKTNQASGEISSHTTPSTRTQIQLRNNVTVGVDVSYCDGTSNSQDVSAAQHLSDLQYHSFSLSDTLQLDGGSPNGFSLAPPPSCNSTFMSSVLLGSFDVMVQTNNFQGCVRDVSYNGAQVDASLLQLSTGTQFGCTRDTAQFYVFSHLELPPFLSRQSQSISLDFSTHSPSGVLYFSRRLPGDATGTMPNDFVAIHLEAGRAVFTFNLGEQNQNVVLNSSTAVNDGLWHRLTAIQNGTMAFFYVDGVLMQARSVGPLVLLDTTGNVFVGGVPSGSRIAGFSDYSGFDGCVRDLEQNGVAADLQGYVSQSNVRFGVCN